MHILVTGGCGYIGSVLIPKLLNEEHYVTSVDTKWFGDFLPKHKKLLNIKMDIRNIEKLSIKGVDSIIHLASIASDPMAELDKNLSWENSALSTFILMNHAIKNGVKRIIYASSGSVYGIKKEKNVTEELSLKPISLYNQVKMITERVILSYSNIEKFIIRPATVCGYSPRMRFDLTVNALTFSALNNKLIKVFGGNQIRPNIHIEDMTDLYLFLLKTDKSRCGIYNAGFENKSVISIAKQVSKNIDSKIKILNKNIDPRSYKLDSTKLKNLGFKSKKNIDDAINELKYMYMKKKITNNPRFYSVKWLKKII